MGPRDEARPHHLTNGLETSHVKSRTISYLGGAHALHHEDEPDVFNSVDPETGATFQLGVGDEVEVSEAKAAQVAEDHPGCFEVDGKVAGERAAAPASDDDLRGQLLAHKRDELNAAAAELGVEAPEALPNKAAVVDAIIEAKGA